MKVKLMNTKRWISAVTIILLSVITYQGVYGVEITDIIAEPVKLTGGVLLHAGGGASIVFRTQNGRSINGIDPQSAEIPYLVLHRNGELTEPGERTLLIKLDGIQVPYPGVAAALNIETQHEETYLDGGENTRIQVWQGNQWISNTDEGTTKTESIGFALEFGDTVSTGYGTINTPTDYFRYDIVITSDAESSQSPLYTFSQDYAFLMENQWVVDLPQALESEPGAAPDELVVYFADMFEYERDPHESSTTLHRGQVTTFVSEELVPAMVAAFQVQSNVWGFVWYPEWTSYRGGVDSERLSVALSEPGLWYHGWGPSSAHSGISISTSAPSYASYDTLLDGMIRFFHHELFHNHQRSLSQHLSGNGDANGNQNILNFFTEGMAQLATSVGGQEVEYAASTTPRDYFAKANAFIAGNELSGDSLNTSYTEMDVYKTEIYWRFLYDQCGSMDVIRKTLEVLYSGEVEIRSPQEIVEKLPQIMDQVFASSEAETCPFNSYRESLSGFARAIYALRLEGGRCGQVGSLGGCGFYDPEENYQAPEAASIFYTGEFQRYKGEIKSSYGMDFVEINLDHSANVQPLNVVITTDPESRAQFKIQALKLIDRHGKIHTITQDIDPQTLVPDYGGRYCFSIPEINIEEYNMLSLVITRSDADEYMDTTGAYAIDLISDHDC